MNTRQVSRSVSVLLLALAFGACGHNDPEAMIASAKSYLAKNDANAAIVQLKNALQQAPNNGEARLLLARALLDGGDAGGAETEVRKAIESKAPADEAYPVLARALLQLGQLQKATELSERKLGDPQAQADLMSSVAFAYVGLGKSDDARKAIEAAFAAAPQYPRAQMAQAQLAVADNHLPEALKLLDAALAQTPNDMQALLLKADVEVSQEHTAQAVKTLQQLVAFTLIGIAAPLAEAQDTQRDAAGCKDSSLLSRIPGCWIEACVQKDFDSLDLYREAEKPDVFEVTKGKPVEGKTAVIEYNCTTNVSPLQIARNAESALRTAGYTVVVSGKITNDVGNHVPAVVAKKGGQWLQVVTDTGGRAYLVSAVQEAAMNQDMKADATAMAAEIQRTGHVAIYGITFDSGQSTINPQSDAVLKEMVTLLTNNPSWRMRIEGHTDNVGTKEFNNGLSTRRSAAVEAWLVAHGVDGARLTHAGYGESRPVGDNGTEEGRAKNRRVEFVKI